MMLLAPGLEALAVQNHGQLVGQGLLDRIGADRPSLLIDGIIFTLIAMLSSLGVDIMPAVTIRNLSEETHRALKVRAAQHNRSAEAEMRAILENAVRPAHRLRLGTALADMSRKIGLTNADVEALEQARDRKPAKPLRLE